MALATGDLELEPPQADLGDPQAATGRLQGEDLVTGADDAAADELVGAGHVGRLLVDGGAQHDVAGRRVVPAGQLGEEADAEGQAGLHVAGPSPVEPSIADLAAQGVARPAVAEGDGVEVGQQHQPGPLAPSRHGRHQVVAPGLDLVGAHVETDPAQAITHPGGAPGLARAGVLAVDAHQLGSVGDGPAMVEGHAALRSPSPMRAARFPPSTLARSTGSGMALAILRRSRSMWLAGQSVPITSLSGPSWS